MGLTFSFFHFTTSPAGVLRKLPFLGRFRLGENPLSRYGSPKNLGFPRNWRKALFGCPLFQPTFPLFRYEPAYGQVRLLPDKGLRYLRTVRVTADAYPWLEPVNPQKDPGIPSRNTRALVRPQPLYISFRFLAGTCVFVKQSPGKLSLRPVPYGTGNPSPEVTGSFFAEFLPQLSPVGLGILYQPTCVGLRYGYLGVIPTGFSRKRICREPRKNPAEGQPIIPPDCSSSSPLQNP